jgi:hypothetical protein
MEVLQKTVNIECIFRAQFEHLVAVLAAKNQEDVNAAATQYAYLNIYRLVVEKRSDLNLKMIHKSFD